jgi:hypothetical protein
MNGNLWKHLGLVIALLVAGVGAGVTGLLLFPFLSLAAYTFAKFCLALLLYAAADGIYFREWTTAEELKKYNVAIGIFNSALLLVCFAVVFLGM